MDILSSGRDIIHTGIFFHKVLGCAAWKYKGLFYFLKKLYIEVHLYNF